VEIREIFCIHMKEFGAILKKQIMKNRLLIFFLLSLNVSLFAQDTVKLTKTVKIYDTIFERKTIKIIDTIVVNESNLIAHDTLNQVLLHSEYNKLYEETLNQKQQHYDSALNNLNLSATIFGLIITIITLWYGIYGFKSLREIKKDLKKDFNDEKQEINKKITDETRRLTGEVYDNQINEINEKLLNFEKYAEDASESFTVKKGKTKPELNQPINTPNSSTNPFNRNNNG
jgi:hypothetical protein